MEIDMTYTLDFSNVKTINEFHRLLKDVFKFPDYYGMNMDAFWDCITGNIDIPSTIYILGISSLPKDLTETKNTLTELLDEAVEWYKSIDMKLDIVYND